MKETLDTLESIGVRMSATKMRVLQSVLRIGLGSERPTFDKICREIREPKGFRPKRAWVYRCLDELEEEGFIAVDKLRRPSAYSATRMTILAGLGRACRSRVAALQEDVRVFTEAIRVLEDTSAQAMSAYVYEIATGGGEATHNERCKRS